jgi:pimeloyl-ACP methyl ester carboxylesterase
VSSPYQSGTTSIRVLLPDGVARCGRAYRVLFVLPVEPGEGDHFGDGLAEIKRLGLHNRFQLICVQPTFSQLPWYADHPSDPLIRQEAYLLNVVIPFLKCHYAIAPGSQNWLLLGFSKSGWGAWNLLLRHPELFGRAAAWDAPLAMTAPDKYRMGPIFGTQPNFERYEILRALERNAPWLRVANRLGLFGYGNFRAQHETVHARLVELGIPHVYRDGPWREHTWSSGWIAEAVEFLTSCAPAVNWRVAGG